MTRSRTSSGTWYVDTPWDAGSGAVSAATAFGRTDGWRHSDGVADAHAIIASGDTVYYNGDTAGDFHWQSEGNDNGGEVIVGSGGIFNMETDTAEIGASMQFDAERFTVTGEGSLFNRFNTGAATNGGALIFGSGNGYSEDGGQNVNVDVLDGGELRNKGQIWFGAYGEEHKLNATMTIGAGAKVSNDGALEGGVSNDDSAGNEGEINFIYSYTASGDDGPGNPVGTNAHDYHINFTGHGGSLTVGKEGIYEQVELADDWTSVSSTQKTYQNLWTDTPLTGGTPILQSGGSSSGAFGNFFAVSGSSGSAGYKLTSIRGAYSGGTHPGDINGDLNVDAADFGTLASNFGTGTLANEGDINSVVGGSGDDVVDAADIGIMFAGWTGDHPTAGAGSATGHYDTSTGEISVSVNGVVNWYVERVGDAVMTGDKLGGLPQAGGMVTNNDIRIGESAFAPFSYDQNLGNVAQTGLPDDGTLRIFWNESLGGELQSTPLWCLNCRRDIVPEPTALVLAALGLVGLGYRRKRV